MNYKSPECLKNTLKRNCRHSSTPPEMQKVAANLGSAKLLEFFAQNSCMLVQQADSMLANLTSALPTASAVGQMKALRNIASDCAKAEFLCQLNWRVVEAENKLILGDSGCLFRLAGDHLIRPFPESPKNIEMVFLPISSARLLVGNKGSECPLLNIEEINLSSARCSREYFVSESEPEQHGRFHPLIGEGAIFFTQEQIKVIAAEAFSGLAKPPI